MADAVEDVEAPAEAEAEATPAPPSSRKSELWLALEVTALTAFTFSRPILDSFGRSPETFVARRASHTDILLFALVVAFVPALVVALAGAATRLFGPTARRGVHVGIVAVLGGLAAWRLGQDITGWPGSATKLELAGILTAATLGLLRWRVPTTATFLRYAGVASVIFLVQFLVMSPASGMVLGSDSGVGGDVAKAVQRSLTAAGERNPPPVIVVVMDAFPTATLLDGKGHIDADAFPHLAELAGSATWYRNSTTVSGYTLEAVPAIFTGRYPARDGSSAVTGGKPENLFTLLGGTYDLHVKEQVTRLCPPTLCQAAAHGDALGGLLGDAVGLWKHGSGAKGEDAVMEVPGVTDVDRYQQFESWIDHQDFSPGGRPDLFAYHVLMPHGPWDTLADGTVYKGSAPPTGTFAGEWGPRGIPVGHERHVLQAQAADRLIGHLIARLKAAGTYDDAVIVVTADHGDSFMTGEPERAVARAQYEQILWQPLLIKAPHQAEGVIDDDNVMSIDILPTIADLLHVRVPWHVDGRPARTAGERDPDVKWFDDDKNNVLRSSHGQRLEFDAKSGFAKVLTMRGVDGTGHGAVWRQPPYGDLFGREVDTLEVGRPAGGSIAMVEPSSGLSDVNRHEPLPLELVGTTHLSPGTRLAWALNGKIGAVVTVQPPDQGDPPMAQGLLPPKLFRGGANQLTAYVVEGSPGAETLRPVDVTW
jgi:Sulfatase